MHAALTAPSYQPGFFYLDLNDTARRAALFTAALTGKLPTTEVLKTEYARALARITDVELNTEAGIRVSDDGPLLESARTRRLVDDSVQGSSYRAEARALARRQIEHALIFLRLRSPRLYQLCDLLVTDVVCWPSDRLRGGSTERLPGVVWFAPSAQLTSIDVAEFLLHETVHMNLHLAEMTFGLFTRAAGRSFSAHSAVLGRKRPYYHAFHSACVAVAMIYFRLLVGLQHEVEALRAPLQRCTSELSQHRAAFTRCAWHAILAAEAFSRAPRLASITVLREPVTNVPAVQVTRSSAAHRRATKVSGNRGSSRRRRFSSM